MVRPPFECIALLLQGGGALGAYQAGVYEALAEQDLHPDWVAGISIGAINAALIAGNAPADRVDRLRRFWQTITTPPPWQPFSGMWSSVLDADTARVWRNQFHAATILLAGAAGFFTPRSPGPFFEPPGSPAATSFYDTAPLKTTLERMIDFDRLNTGGMRLSVGAVNVRTGNFVYFDNTTHRIGPEHIMASGALPPGFPAVEIDGDPYWDGGLISNTPLQWVVQASGARQDTLAFQVDLWSARGAVPRDLAETAVRQKEIQFSSRTRANTDQFKHLQRIRGALANLLERLPADLAQSEDAALLRARADHKIYNIVHLIYRSKTYEGDSKDFNFSRLSMEEHWRTGYHDAEATLRHPEIFERPTGNEGVMTFDFTQAERA